MTDDILERAKAALGSWEGCEYDHCKLPDAVEELIAEVERLRSLLEPVKCDADLPVNAIRARDNYYTEILRLEKERNNTESGLLEDIADLSDEITAKDARIKELEADRIAYRNLGSRIEDLETYIERLEAAFLEAKSRLIQVTENKSNPCGLPLRYTASERNAMAREALEEIKNGND